MTTQVIVYNASFEPLDKVPLQQAIRMLFRQVAVVHEPVKAADGAPRMIGPHEVPKAVRLVRYVAAVWMHRPASYNRHDVLVRDKFTCAYCRGYADTVDHIQPESRGGEWSWLNNVAACHTCNSVKKRNRTPAEAGMRLLWEPFVPTKAHIAALRAEKNGPSGC